MLLITRDFKALVAEKTSERRACTDINFNDISYFSYHKRIFFTDNPGRKSDSKCCC